MAWSCKGISFRLHQSIPNYMATKGGGERRAGVVIELELISKAPLINCWTELHYDTIRYSNNITLHCDSVEVRPAFQGSSVRVQF